MKPESESDMVESDSDVRHVRDTLTDDDTAKRKLDSTPCMHPMPVPRSL